MKRNYPQTTRGGMLNSLPQYMLCLALLLASISTSFAQTDDAAPMAEDGQTQARVTGLRYICVHVIELEKSLELYQEILGFQMDDAEVLKGPGVEGMLVMKLKADDLTIALSVTAPQFMHTIEPIGNTNHNHFMLKVNDIGPIGDKLKAAGYELENEHYVRDKYTFFEGPNGEIVGLSAW
ncbi:VOC family protein [Pontibacter sp. G13]|uniref:VOC family protein n=1 Tax=Pontibacter sp. G13 TaxID=3074898 RepID=UPI00288C3129|nr:VOC family protein [Pontibacter sp. G13]WNJ17567.1 VOC family protein [Pontibacter sp. G13]